MWLALSCVDVQLALKRTQDAALERLTVAATEGDLESVRNLLARGLPINKVAIPSIFNSIAVWLLPSELWYFLAMLLVHSRNVTTRKKIPFASSLSSAANKGTTEQKSLRAKHIRAEHLRT